MEYQTIKTEVINNVGRIYLDRAEAGNSVTLEFARELESISSIFKEKKEVRVVVIAGRGKHFSVGGDLKAFAEKSNISSHLREVTVPLHQAINNLVTMKKPVVAEVNGTVAGGGIGIVCAADIVVASENSRFVMAYTKAGLTPDGSTSYFLPRLIGLKKSLELALLNRKLTAEEALQWGIVTRVCQEEQLSEEVQKIANELIAGATEAFGLTKELLYHSFEHTLLEQMEKESLQISDRVSSEEGQEGIRAFLEKRKPDFSNNTRT
ncbi:enoyl-CoA hydratase/isomerase family protein [Pseudalkalibacillus caeni]|uniref:enoyl-CoA hydratase/isomerase family protein n=1 Tax=Exobacillus caeni TaxID=2574798 RepID=UPI00148581C7|nr:enoyl-CoA hydratase/isomerase family protein [Pseudalkalibacillus caeni]